MKQYQIPINVLQAIVNYLNERPHKEVANLLKALMDVCRAQESKPEVVESEKSEE